MKIIACLANTITFTLIMLIAPLDLKARDILPLTIGVALNAGDIPPLIGIAKGFYKNAGLDITVRSWAAGKLALEAMLRGEVDVATVADTPIALNSFIRSDFVIIATFSVNNPYRLVADRSKGINSAHDLRTRRIGVMKGTTSHYFLDLVLADNKISPNEIFVIDVVADNSVTAILHDEVDAIAAFDPHGYWVERALADRAYVLPYDKSLHEETFNFVVRKDVLASKLDAIIRLLNATKFTIEWSSNHRNEAIFIASQQLNIDIDALNVLWSNYRHSMTLDQTLIHSLENHSRWAIRSGIVGQTRVPNFLNYIEEGPLKFVNPNVVNIIR